MKYPRRKRIICILTALALLAALGAAYTAFGVASSTEAVKDGILKKLSCISSTYTRLCQRRAQIESHYDSMLMGNVMLSTWPLRELAAREGDPEIRAYESGFVLRVDGDDLALPQELSRSSLDARNFRDASGRPLNSGSFYCAVNGPNDETYLCMFHNITGDYYYLDYTPSGEREEYVRSYIDATSLLNQLESVFQGHILIYSPDDGENALLYTSPFFGDCVTLEEAGIDPNLPARTFDFLRQDGTECIYALSEPVTLSGARRSFRVAFAAPYAAAVSQPPSRLIVLLGVAALAFVVAVAWMLSVCGLVRRSVLSEAQREQYGAARVRRVIAGIGVAGALVMILMSMFTGALLRLYDATLENQYMLDLLCTLESQAKVDEATVKAHQEDIYVSCAQRIANLLHTHPQLCNAETLQEICRAIDVDYLMLFDDRGNEILSNAPFVNLSLGDGMQYGGSDFRRLLKGMPAIVHEPGLDEATGLERQLIGVCMADDDISDGYGALILARCPEEEDADIMTIDDQMREMTTEDSLCLIIDPETGDILHSNHPDYIGDNALTLGMPERALQNHYMDYYRFDNRRWYGCSGASEGRVYHVAARAGVTYDRLFRNALVYGGLFLVAYALLAAVLLFGYTEANIDIYGAIEAGDTRDDRGDRRLKDLSGALPPRKVSKALREMDVLNRYKSPQRHALSAFNVTLGVILILMAVGQTIQRANGSSFFLLSYVMGGGWEQGANLFAFARIFLMAAMTWFAVTVLDLVCTLLCHLLEKRGETICRLVNSTVKYVAMLIVLLSSFNYLGFDTRALLASVGILSLAVSLGAKDLVADVLSGISIAFSDEYQIGDYVEIKDGATPFKGWVLEIGVRTTTLVNNDGHIKTMSNRDVKNVLNLSRRNCRYTIDITVGYDQSLQQLEEILNRELPKIGEGVDEILNGPTYLGITSIGNGGMTLTIVAECKEHNYGKVRTRLNREIRLMLEKNGIAIK